jgi:hypothetical protein
MALFEDVARLADEVRQGSADAKTEITTFPSGAASLRIRVGGRVFDLDYFPSQGMFGVDELEADAAFNSGYRFGFKDFESAKAKLLQLMEEAPVVSAAVPDSLPIVMTSK